MQNELPPLTALVAFEAAGRQQSFTRAAEELHVTQAAISRQIRLLEQHVGKALFLRAHRRVELTMEGRAYLHTVVNALSHIGAATRDLRQTPGGGQLTIAADHSIAHLWLMPRLAAFRKAHLDLGFAMIVSDDEKECLVPDADVALIHGDGNWPAHNSELLFAEEVFPVCSPAYANELPGRSLADAANAHLLELDDSHWNWINWRQWLAAQGAGQTIAARPLVIGSYPLMIEAARQGLGLALGWRGLVDADLASGRLVAPWRESVKTRFGYHLVWPRGRTPSPAALAFLAWAKAAAASAHI